MAGNIHLKLDGVEGESEIKGFEKQIDVDSIDFGASMVGTADRGGGLTDGKGQLDDITLIAQFDKSTPILFEKCMKGEHIGKGEITFKKAGGSAQTYITIKLEHILVKDVAVHGGGEGGTPGATIILQYDVIDLDYKPQTSGGSLGGKAGFRISRKTLA